MRYLHTMVRVTTSPSKFCKKGQRCARASAGFQCPTLGPGELIPHEKSPVASAGLVIGQRKPSSRS